MPFNLDAQCQDGEQICQQVEEWTGSHRAANIADLLIGKPLALFGLFLLLLVVRWVLHRVVDRVVKRAAGKVSDTDLPADLLAVLALSVQVEGHVPQACMRAGVNPSQPIG